MTIETILSAAQNLRASSDTALVGISGFAGSGKSTLARQISESLSNSVRIRGDDFLDPARSHHRSPDWDGVERLRLRDEVLTPLRAGTGGVFRRFDWATRELGTEEPLPHAAIVIVDAIGLFHPEMNGAFDLTIWVDVDLDIATAQGKARDRRLGRSHKSLWDDVWVPNERDFAERFDPRSTADLLFVPDHLSS